MMTLDVVNRLPFGPGVELISWRRCHKILGITEQTRFLWYIESWPTILVNVLEIPALVWIPDLLRMSSPAFHKTESSLLNNP